VGTPTRGGGWGGEEKCKILRGEEWERVRPGGVRRNITIGGKKGRQREIDTAKGFASARNKKKGKVSAISGKAKKTG